MGIRSYVRDRKNVKADRSTELGIAGHQAATRAMGSALGFGRTQAQATPSGRLRNEIYHTRKNSNPDIQESAGGGTGVSYTGQDHVKTIPAGSKPRTGRNSDWDAPAGQVAKD